MPGPGLAAAAADGGTAGAAVAGAARAGQGSVLPPGARAGPAGLVGLHAHGEPGRDPSRSAVSAPAVPLRVDLLELGVRAGVLFGEFRQPQRWAAGRFRGTGRCARASSHRPHDPGGSPRREPRAVHVGVSGPDASLRRDARGHERLQRSRERRLRAEPSAFQGGPGAGVAVTWQSGLRQPGGVRTVRACVGGPAERVPRGEVCRGASTAGPAAGASAGDVGASAGPGEPGGDDPGEEEHLLGAGAFAGGVGRGPQRCRGDRGVVRGGAGADDGTAAWPVETPDRLSPRDRLAGAETRGVRALCVPRGPVPECDVSAGLRRAGGAAAWACGPGVRAGFVPGGPGGGGACRGSVGAAPGRASAGERTGGADVAVW
jgi:hypothetical protein